MITFWHGGGAVVHSARIWLGHQGRPSGERTSHPRLLQLAVVTRGSMGTRSTLGQSQCRSSLMPSKMTAIAPLILCFCLSTNVAAQQPAPPTAEEVAKRQLAQEERFHNDWPNLQRYRDANAKLSSPVKK